ncbi:NPCBM/NEW2 domain-containing protein [Kitasatospora purpeofusca]|uniref:NPCBM/NEW2 domain-containing protein n=1 Tax=Kitasatospora purpeofusca TaxID=67352 RepID=UPI0035DF486D
MPGSSRRLGEIAALVSAGTAVAGLLLGFFGLPTLVNSPTARTVTETVTATATVTVTAARATVATPAPPAAGQSSQPAPTSADRISLVNDLLPVAEEQGPYDHGSQKVNGQIHPTTLSSSCSITTWQLDRQYTTFTATLGAADSTGPGSKVLLYVELDGVRKIERNMAVGSTVPVTLDLRGVFRITLGSMSCNSYHPEDVGSWIDPAITKAP